MSIGTETEMPESGPRMRRMALTQALAGLCVAYATATAAECPELIGRLPYGPATAVAASGDLVLYASGPMLMIADVADPANPVVLGEFELPDTTIHGIAVSGDHAYVANSRAGIRVVDISDPSAPVEVGARTLNSYAYGVAVSGTRVIAVSWWAGFYVFDITTPSSPEEIGFLDMGFNMWDVAVEGDLAFIAGSSDNGLRLVDVADPSMPADVGVLEIPGEWTRGVDVVKGTAYVAHSWGLTIADVSQPSAPVAIGELRGFFASDVVV
jgi:hypothetical protein